MIDLSMKKMTVFWRGVKAWVEKVGPELLFAFLLLVGLLGMVLFITLIAVMFSEYVECRARGVLGTQDKRDTIQFIGLGIAGILAFFGAIAVNRRAEAQVKTAVAQSKNNELVERGHVQERFKAAVEHLGRKQVTAHIASFYEFYHLARDNEDLRKNIFGILCAHLRQTTNDKGYQGKDRPTEDVQILLDILFKSEDKQGESVFAELDANLQRIFLAGVNLQKMDLQRVDLQEADLRCAQLHLAKLQDANLVRVNLQGAQLLYADLQGAKLLVADLRGADLRGANLSKADLRIADLEGANLQEANLEGANLQEARNLEKADLSGAKIKGTEFPEGYKPPEDADIMND